MWSVDDARRYVETRDPWMRRMVRRRFAELGRGPEMTDSLVQLCVSLTWKYYRDLVIRGDVTDETADKLLRTTLYYAMLQAIKGRDIVRGSGKRGPDVTDPFDRERRGEMHREEGFDFVAFVGDVPVFDAVQFHMDMPAFFDACLSEKQRGMARDLMSGDTTNEVAAKHGVSAAAVSQFRRRFMMLYHQFFGDDI